VIAYCIKGFGEIQSNDNNIWVNGKHRGDGCCDDPVEQNANCSVKERVGGGWRSAGYKNLCTIHNYICNYICNYIIHYIICDKTGVIEIGLKSE